MIFVYITTGKKEEAKKIAKELIEKKLAACANIFPIESTYAWNDKIEETEEFVLILKTVTKKYSEIAREVKKIHSYATPCICKIEVEANIEYFEYLKKEIK